jgi:HEAT repeat protein
MMRFFGSPKSPDLAKLKAADPRARKAAAEALGLQGDTNAVGPLIAVLSDDDAEVRWSAAEALGRLGDVRAVEPLLAVAIRDPRLSVRSAAGEAIVQVGEPAVKPLIGALPGLVAAELLGRLGDKRAVLPLIEVLPIHAAIVALGELGDDRAVEPLLRILQGDDLLDRASAARSLGKIGDRRALEPLLAVLGDTRQDEFGEWREAVAAALGKLSDSRAIEPLVAVYRSPDASEALRTTAAHSLERLGVPPELVGSTAERHPAAS